MSLVAYGASDDSDESETESQPKEDLKDVPISDDEDEIHTKHSGISSSTSVSASTPSTTTSIFFKSSLDLGSNKQGAPLLHKTDVIEETELEQEVRQKPAELADAPKPPPKRTKHPVKISIPSLSDIPDEEEDDYKPKPVASSVRSGLFSLLPAPIHSAKKEINRPLIPHSLGKKAPPPPPKPATVKPKSVSSASNGNNAPSTKTALSSGTPSKSNVVQNALAGYGSDSDDDNDDDNDDQNETNTSQNFFSLNSSKQLVDDNSSVVCKESAAEVKDGGDKSEITPAAQPLSNDEDVVSPLEPGLTNNSPLSFSNAAKYSSWSSASSNYLGGLRPLVHQPHASTSSYNLSYPQQSSVQYNMVDSDETEPINQFTDPDDGDLQKVLGDKEFQRLNGKRKRGTDEAINFVDAKVDDYVDPSELSKYLTEESEYAPKKNKDDMPTSQQKRKKQITYLAFQAKEKELELKNTWAQNKLTKRQTQAKYGF